MCCSCKCSWKLYCIVIFTLRNQTLPTVQMGIIDLPQKNKVKFLGMHLKAHKKN
jgi:hypothetical protein